MIQTMKWENSSLILLDQTKLPNEVVTITCTSYKHVAKAISRLEVRGAPAIGAAAAFAMVLGWREICNQEPKISEDKLLLQLKLIAEDLINTRPTAINLAWGVNKIYSLAQRLVLDKKTNLEIENQLELKAISIFDDDILINKKIGYNGATLLEPGSKVLTHCNAGALATCGWGTALGVIRQAFADGKITMVYADETRPLLQGSRLTAWELEKDEIPVTLITDNMASWTMKTKGIDAVIVGADRIAINGDTANKIGTYSVAIAAHYHKIPFYIAAPLSTFDFSLPTGNNIPIEERSAEEVRNLYGNCIAPKTVTVFNPAFDVTPAELITGIITEHGVLKPPYTENIMKLKQLLEED